MLVIEIRSPDPHQILKMQRVVVISAHAIHQGISNARETCFYHQ